MDRPKMMESRRCLPAIGGWRYFHISQQALSEDAVFNRRASVEVNISGLVRKDTEVSDAGQLDRTLRD